MKKTVFLLAFILPVCTLIAQLPEPDSPVAGNVSLVEQDGGFNFVAVSQDGDYNLSTVETVGWFNEKSYVDQTGSMNVSTVNQAGWGNTVDVTQLNDPGQTDEDNLNFSWINQTGNGNSAEVDQEHADFDPPLDPGHPGTLDAFIDQSGNGNSATQYQKGAVNLAITNQMGNGGMAVQKQGNSQYIDGNSYGGFAAIVQLASSNGSEAQQHQAGVFNVAGIIQGSDLSVAKQEQVSDKDGHPDDLLDLPNVAGIIQMEGVVFHRGNKAYQVQYYDGVSEYGNWAGALQVGGHNVSVQKQIGGNNLSGVDQHGLANEAYVSQTNGATPPAMGMSVPGPF